MERQWASPSSHPTMTPHPSVSLLTLSGFAEPSSFHSSTGLAAFFLPSVVQLYFNYKSDSGCSFSLSGLLPGHKRPKKNVLIAQLGVPPAQGNAWVPQNEPALPHLIPGTYSAQEHSKQQANLIFFLKNTVLPVGVMQKTTTFTYFT